MIRAILFFSLVSLAPSVTFAQTERYATLSSGKSIIIGEGETALMTSFVGVNSFLSYNAPDNTSLKIFLTHASSSSASGVSFLSSENPLPLVGPATLTLELDPDVRSDLQDHTTVIGMRIVSTAITLPREGTPSTAVVIPSNASGSVEVILETSQDLITWTRIEPGEFDPSTSNRFFRVRAERK